MIILPEDKPIVSLLTADDAKCVFLALISDGSDTVGLSQQAAIVYTVISERNKRISKTKSAAGKLGGAKQNNQNARKQAEQAEPEKTNETTLRTDTVSEPYPNRTETVSAETPPYPQQGECGAEHEESTPAQQANRRNLSHNSAESDTATPLGARFDEFWSTYPRKVGKEAARKSWAKIKPTRELHAKIMVAIGLAVRSDDWQRENGRYIPNPATWLNQGRWDDEPMTAVPQVTDNVFARLAMQMEDDP